MSNKIDLEEIDLENDFANAKSTCASKMLKDNRSFIDFCNARTWAFIKNYMKDPEQEWNFGREDVEYAKKHSFDAWYGKIDVRDYFADAGLLNKLLAGLSADEIKILLYGEMLVFYHAFNKDARKDGAEGEPKDGVCDKNPQKEDEAETHGKCAACGFHAAQAAQAAQAAAAKREEQGEDRDAGLGGDLDGDLDDDGEFLCADLKELVDSLRGNIGVLAKELKSILSEEEGKKDAPKKQGGKRRQ